MATETEQIEVPAFNPFGKDSWSDTPSVKQEEITNIETKDTVIEGKKEEDTEVRSTDFDTNKFIKETFDYDDVDTAKKSIAELKEKAKDFEFANEDSKKLFEYVKDGKEDDLYEFLSKKKKVDKLSTADLTNNKGIATELVKFGIQNDNPALDADEVDFIFNKRFGLPSKPEQGSTEDDDDFKERETLWQDAIKDKERELIIEAKMNQPKMAKLKTELVLPDIKRETVTKSKEQEQEELQKIEAVRSRFLNKIESDFGQFNGYEATYKEEDFDVPAKYVVTDDQKVAFKEEIKNFNIDEFINDRWFSKENGEVNVKQMMEDIYLLKNTQQVMQKIANETGAGVLTHYRKIKSNVDVGGSQENTLQNNDAQTQRDKEIAYFWKQK